MKGQRRIPLHGNEGAIIRHRIDRTPVCDLCLDVACYLEHLRARRVLRGHA